MRTIAFAVFVLHSALSVAALAQGWTLSTADLRTEPVMLARIDEKGVHVTAAGETKDRVIPPESFVQLDRSLAPVERPARFMLHLVSGDRVGGEPVKVENDRLTWRNPAVGELTVPLAQVAALTKSAPAPPPDLSGTRSEDVVLLANGDTVRGIVSALSEEAIRIKTANADEPLAVPLDSVVSVQFASTGGPATSPAGATVPTYRIRLDDGSSIVGTSLSASDDKLRIALSPGEDPRPLDLARVAGIEHVNGPVSWLTSRTPSEDVQVPFVGSPEQAMWRTRIDTDVAGQPFIVGGRTFKRGIGVHAYSRLVFPLDGSYKAFRTRYGINDSLVRGDVTVRIRLDDKVVHEAKNVRPGVLSPVVLIDLGSAKQLVLEVDYGQGIDVEDRLNWLEPALLR